MGEVPTTGRTLRRSNRPSGARGASLARGADAIIRGNVVSFLFEGSFVIRRKIRVVFVSLGRALRVELVGTRRQNRPLGHVSKNSAVAVLILRNGPCLNI